MFYFIAQLVFFLSLGVMIFLLSQKLPLIEESASSLSSSEKKGKKPFYFHWIEVLDKEFLSFLSLFLRKLRLWVMKIDNWVSRSLEKVSQKANFQANQGNLIKEISSSDSEEKEKKEENKDTEKDSK
ncbi:MAG: hypothetical protein KatS3mg098_457 [Candidatus Parcubacteria bacterium]|nr:hypothetical protein [Patescibacteria group bacterium]BCX16228.1 MAG: hypothetical protein KatS3mg098_457 [Candidatus Parcubacteria bacterium]